MAQGYVGFEEFLRTHLSLKVYFRRAQSMAYEIHMSGTQMSDIPFTEFQLNQGDIQARINSYRGLGIHPMSGYLSDESDVELDELAQQAADEPSDDSSNNYSDDYSGESSDNSTGTSSDDPDEDDALANPPKVMLAKETFGLRARRWIWILDR
jgi:hypothetical protein